jgi:hypothetical protein
MLYHSRASVSRLTKRAPEPRQRAAGAGCAGAVVVGVCAFSGSFLGSSRFHQSGWISSHPPAGTHRVLRKRTLLEEQLDSEWNITH